MLSRRTRMGNAVETDREQEQHAGQHSRQLGGEVGESKAVLKHGDREETEQGADHRAASTEDRGSSQNHRGDREQFVAQTGVGLRLAKMRHVDDRGETGDEPREREHLLNASLNRDTRVSRPLGREADRDEPATDGRNMEQDVNDERDHHERGELRREAAPEVALPQKEERVGELGEVVDTSGQALGEAAKERKRPERDDQRRGAQTRDHEAVERSRQCSDAERDRRRDWDRHSRVAIQLAKKHRRKPHQRADGQVDLAANDDGRQREGQEPDLDTQPAHLEGIGQRKKVRSRPREDRDFQQNQHPEDRLGLEGR